MTIYFAILLCAMSFIVGAALGGAAFPNADWIEVLKYAGTYLGGNFVAFLIVEGKQVWSIGQEKDHE